MTYTLEQIGKWIHGKKPDESGTKDLSNGSSRKRKHSGKSALIFFSRSIASLARSLRLSLIPWRSATSPNCSNTEFIAGRGQGNGREISPRKGSRTKDQRMKSIGFWFTEKVSTKRSATIRIDYFSLQKVG